VIRLWHRHLSAVARAYAGMMRTDRATPWREGRYAVVDFETTGLDPSYDEVISFASVPIDEGRIAVGGVETAIVRPAQMPDGTTIRIHGLRPVDLEQAPPLSEVLDLILSSLTGRALVAHVAWIERGFLEAMLRPIGLRPPRVVIDTAALATRVLGEHPLGLSDLARRLELPVHSPHTADGDALTTAQVFLALATHLDRTNAQTVGSLAVPRHSRWTRR
jgi:DNA polymerase-3 subunit epsilon